MSTTTSVMSAKSWPAISATALRPPITAPSLPKMFTAAHLVGRDRGSKNIAVRARTFQQALWRVWPLFHEKQCANLTFRKTELARHCGRAWIEARTGNEQNAPFWPSEIGLHEAVDFGATVGDAGIPSAAHQEDSFRRRVRSSARRSRKPPRLSVKP